MLGLQLVYEGAPKACDFANLFQSEHARLRWARCRRLLPRISPGHYPCGASRWCSVDEYGDQLDNASGVNLKPTAKRREIRPDSNFSPRSRRFKAAPRRFFKVECVLPLPSLSSKVRSSRRNRSTVILLGRCSFGVKRASS